MCSIHMPTFFLIHLSQSAKLLISLCKLESSYEIVLPVSTRYTDFFLKLPLIDLIYPPSKHFMMILILVLIEIFIYQTYIDSLIYVIHGLVLETFC